MKIDVDLSAFYDEEGNEVTDSLKTQIEAAVVRQVVLSVTAAMNSQIEKVIAQTIKEQINKKMEEIVPILMDYEFTETTSWGEKKGTHTVHNRILKEVESHLILQKDRRYDSDKNPLTKAVDDAVERKLKGFKEEVNKQVDQKFVADAMDYAERKLRERLNIK